MHPQRLTRRFNGLVARPAFGSCGVTTRHRASVAKAMVADLLGADPLKMVHAAPARRRTSATTSRSRSTSSDSKRASGPCGLRSVKGDS